MGRLDGLGPPSVLCEDVCRCHGNPALFPSPSLSFLFPSQLFPSSLFFIFRPEQFRQSYLQTTDPTRFMHLCFFSSGPLLLQQRKNKLWIMVSIIHSSMNECKIYFDVIIFLNKALQWFFFKYECTFATHTVHNRLVHKLFDFFQHKMAYIGLLCQFFFTCRCKYISLKVTYTNNSEYY